MTINHTCTHTHAGSIPPLTFVLGSQWSTSSHLHKLSSRQICSPLLLFTPQPCPATISHTCTHTRIGVPSLRFLLGLCSMSLLPTDPLPLLSCSVPAHPHQPHCTHKNMHTQAWPVLLRSPTLRQSGVFGSASYTFHSFKHSPRHPHTPRTHVGLAEVSYFATVGLAPLSLLH
jgi:hypothetical protein